MTEYKLYIFDDKLLKWKYLPYLINMLNCDVELKRFEISIENHYSNDITEDFNTFSIANRNYNDVFLNSKGTDDDILNSSKMIKNALEDPKGIYLIDIDLSPKEYFNKIHEILQNEEVNKEIETYFNNINKTESQGKEDREFKVLKNLKGDHPLSVWLLMYCLLKEKKVFFISQYKEDYSILRNRGVDLLSYPMRVDIDTTYPNKTQDDIDEIQFMLEKSFESLKKYFIDNESKPSIFWPDFIKVRSQSALLNEEGNIAYDKLHNNIDKGVMSPALKKFLGITDDEKFYEVFMQNPDSPFFIETLKQLYGETGLYGISIGWLLGAGIFRWQFPGEDFKKIWQPENTIIYNVNDAAKKDLRRPSLLIECPDHHEIDIRESSIGAFCELCENLFKHCQTEKCILHKVDFSHKKMSFHIKDFDFSQFFKALKDKIKNKNNFSKGTLTVGGDSKQNGPCNLSGEHDTSSTLLNFYVKSKFSAAQSGESGLFPGNVFLNIKEKTQISGIEVIFGAPK